MTQQRAIILNQFYIGASGSSRGFLYKKDPSTLSEYFKIWKQLLAYYYRVVYSKSHQFTVTNPEQEPELPQAIIEPTLEQQLAIEEIQDALDLDPKEDEDLTILKTAIRKFNLALICHSIGGAIFKSPVLSYCSMLSRRVYKQQSSKEDQETDLGLWKEPGNYNHYLSALTWTAQLLIFEYAYYEKQEDEDQIPIVLAKVCDQYF